MTQVRQRGSLVLDALGLSDPESAVYRLLVRQPSVAADVARDLGLNAGEVARALDGLEARGLVARSAEDPERYAPAPPAVGLAALLLQRREQLDAAQDEVARLAEVYRRGVETREPRDLVDVVRGPQAVAQRYAQLQQTARTEILTFVRSSIEVVTPDQNDPEEEAALARGVAYRIVLESAALERPGFLGILETGLHRGLQVRVVPRVPMRLFIVDRETAMISLNAADDPDPTPGALIVHRSGILDALVTLFDTIWGPAPQLGLDRAGEVTTTSSHHLDPTDTRIMAHLQVGLTDHAIAGHLGLSLRTVQRRVRALMETAGVETRFQLGIAATRLGWV